MLWTGGREDEEKDGAWRGGKEGKGREGGQRVKVALVSKRNSMHGLVKLLAVTSFQLCVT